MKLEDNRKGAVLSPDRTYRYDLWRVWDHDKPRVGFLMLNPSTADEQQLDPTVRRCQGFAKAWGYGGLHVGNLFALRSPDPGYLYGHEDPIGPRNDEALTDLAVTLDRIVLAWGNHGSYQDRAKHVLDLIEPLDAQLYCLTTTSTGHPGHPLYIPQDTTPTPFQGLEVTPP